MLAEELQLNVALAFVMGKICFHFFNWKFLKSFRMCIHVRLVVAFHSVCQ